MKSCFRPCKQSYHNTNNQHKPRIIEDVNQIPIFNQKRERKIILVYKSGQIGLQEGLGRHRIAPIF